jgi:SAM-dependent methyltransferase
MDPIPFTTEPVSVTQVDGQPIYNFDIDISSNIDAATVESFGMEWTKFNHFTDQEIESIASEHYFDIVKPEWIENKRVLDVGCGTGRWSKFMANSALSVDAVDPSKAVEAASHVLSGCNNVRLSRQLQFRFRCQSWCITSYPAHAIGHAAMRGQIETGRLFPCLSLLPV